MVVLQCLKPIRRAGLDAKSRAVAKRASQVVERVFHSERKKSSRDVSISLVGRATMRKLHRDFLNDPTDTDVLSFPSDEGGDIAVCVPVAFSNARRFGEPPARELLRLIVHGTLHLLGYKDKPLREKKKMWKKQERLVAELDR